MRKTILVGSLAATQALTIDYDALRASENPAALMDEARQTLRVMLWRQIYGRAGGIVKHLLATANEAGDLRYLSPLKDLWALFNPQVQTPAPEAAEETPPAPVPCCPRCTLMRMALRDYHLAIIRMIEASNEGDFTVIHNAAEALGDLARKYQPLAEEAL